MATVVNVPKDTRFEALGQALGLGGASLLERNRRDDRMQKFQQLLDQNPDASAGELANLAAESGLIRDTDDFINTIIAARARETTRAGKTRQVQVHGPGGESMTVEVSGTTPAISTMQQLETATGRKFPEGFSLTKPRVTTPTESERRISDELKAEGLENTAKNRAEIRRRIREEKRAQDIIEAAIGEQIGEGLFDIPEERGAEFAQSLERAFGLIAKGSSGSEAARQVLSAGAAKARAQEEADRAAAASEADRQRGEPGVMDRVLEGLQNFLQSQDTSQTSPQSRNLEDIAPPRTPGAPGAVPAPRIPAQPKSREELENLPQFPTTARPRPPAEDLSVQPLEREVVNLTGPNNEVVQVPRGLWENGSPMEIVRHIMSNTGLPYATVRQMLIDSETE